jgi:16S rRNA (guanine966-N2)-methyltransferase
LDHMMHFSFAKNYGGSVFSFYELESNSEDSFEDEEE